MAAPDIDTYLEEFEGERRERLDLVRKTVHSLVPGTDETMAYGIPTFNYEGQHIVHVAGFKNHLGLYPTPAVIRHFSEALKDYKTATGTIQFPWKRPLPIQLIKEIVRYRVDQIITK
jgi:uncharacterized protein YdhG (YjbR/CyaY superfamily)